MDEAQHLIDEAIDKDDNDPFVHYVASLLGLWKKDYERWAQEADKALSLNPNYGHAQLMLEAWCTSIRESRSKGFPTSSKRCALTRPNNSTDISLAPPISWLATMRPRQRYSKNVLR